VVSGWADLKVGRYDRPVTRAEPRASSEEGHHARADRQVNNRKVSTIFGRFRLAASQIIGKRLRGSK
jgi:hypothetical protein